MKIAVPSDEALKQKLKPPLPLEVESLTEDDETKVTRFKLRTTPTAVDSPTYYYTMRKLEGSESLRQAIQFTYDMPMVITGLNITTATNKKAIHLQVLSGPPLTNFNAGYNVSNVEELLGKEDYESLVGRKAQLRRMTRQISLPITLSLPGTLIYPTKLHLLGKDITLG